MGSLSERTAERRVTESESVHTVEETESVSEGTAEAAGSGSDSGSVTGN